MQHLSTPEALEKFFDSYASLKDVAQASSNKIQKASCSAQVRTKWGLWVSIQGIRNIAWATVLIIWGRGPSGKGSMTWHTRTRNDEEPFWSGNGWKTSENLPPLRRQRRSVSQSVAQQQPEDFFFLLLRILPSATVNTFAGHPQPWAWNYIKHDTCEGVYCAPRTYLLCTQMPGARILTTGIKAWPHLEPGKEHWGRVKRASHRLFIVSVAMRCAPNSVEAGARLLPTTSGLLLRCLPRNPNIYYVSLWW